MIRASGLTVRNFQGLVLMNCLHAYTLILKLRKYPSTECLHHLKIELLLEGAILGLPSIL